jgi:hypothetical protein
VEKRITVPGSLEQACNEFNSGQYFECHETLEEVWREEQGELSDFYKGLIQVAAAFVHAMRGNDFGANKLLTTALGYLARYRNEGAMGFDVDALCEKAEAARERVRELGRGHTQEIERELIPRYAFDGSKLRDEAQRWGAWGFDRDGNAFEMEITVIE